MGLELPVVPCVSSLGASPGQAPRGRAGAVGAPGLKLRANPTRLEDEAAAYHLAGSRGRPCSASPGTAPPEAGCTLRVRAAWRRGRARGRGEVVRPYAGQEIEGRRPNGGRLERRCVTCRMVRRRGLPP
ncbi:hypothetical protein NDU88_006625 [Pleurodeles waltl]|uniref:Uncharacterized protein n=1 Tax=Pleurodeles waltl TaxID=8319 RepID=A0AAV7L852_PLEWA|nr:hypothetical protein NDU88_006625 [Pleurodeles waltl]